MTGAIVALLAAGVFARGPAQAALKPNATLPPVTPTAVDQMYTRVKSMVVKDLGPSYPNPRLARLLSLTLVPVAPPVLRRIGPSPIDRLRTVVIVFRLNDHPLGKAWRLRTAKADVFVVMKSLYASQLPIYNVEMIGEYPMPRNHVRKLRRVLTAFLDHTTASQIPWKHWRRTDESTLWSMLTYSSVNKAFA
ncbi:MAG: hypothetical protein ACRDFS_05700 [Chloroflexota bacterium]